VLTQLTCQIKQPNLHLSLDISEVIIHVQVIVAPRKYRHQSEQREAQEDENPESLGIVFGVLHHIDNDFEHEDRPYRGDFDNGELSSELDQAKLHQIIDRVSDDLAVFFLAVDGPVLIAYFSVEIFRFLPIF